MRSSSDYTTGIEATITDFPAPDVLWQRYCFAAGIKTPEIEERVLTPSRWNRKGEHRRPKILFLADRNFLVDVPRVHLG